MSIYVIGAGGHAKVVIATLQAMGAEVAEVLDDDVAKHGAILLGIPVSGPVERAAGGDRKAIIAIGDNVVRRKISERLAGVRWTTAVHPDACVHPSVKFGAGSVVCAGAVVQPNAHIGQHAIVNTGATVDHDSMLADFVHVAPGVHLAGDVRVDEGAMIGIGACAISGVHVGAWTKVGAGAAVVYNLPADITAVGVPAMPIQGRLEA
jgi:sugar O-acyltransferase (sialic acid O-acetyltransferase NeuD family)